MYIYRERNNQKMFLQVLFHLIAYHGYYRFLALKNLASVFLQQGSSHYENALQCYLQAVEIDTKDSVVWNQLGTLSCSMGVLSISRWAFEQGLLCSPNNCEFFIQYIYGVSNFASLMFV